MFGKPSTPNAVPVITVIVVVFVIVYASMALFAMQTAHLCGPACSVLMAAVHP
jgi:hypothetical protein